MKKIFTEEIANFIRENASGRAIKDIVVLVNDEFRTSFTATQIRSFMRREKIHNGMWGNKGPHYTKAYPKEIVDFVIENHKGIGPKEMSGILNEKFGMSYTKEQISNLYNRKHLNSGVTGYFEKGRESGNKGKRWDEFMSKEAQERSRKTVYKKGHIPLNHKHVGSIRISAQKTGHDKDTETQKVYMIKVSEPNKWVPLHRLNYEAAYGPIPKGHVIVFADKNGLNPDPQNLVAVPRSLMTMLNQWLPDYHNRQELETLLLLAKNRQAISKIKHQIKKHYKECWKNIPGYSGKYQASTEGNIRRLYKNGKMRVLTPFIRKSTGKDDLFVKISGNGDYKDLKLSLLVYRTWVGDIYEDMNIVHLDGNRNNNRPSNLNAVSKKNLGSKYGYLSKAKIVLQLDKDGNVINTYRSAREAAKENGMSYQTVIDRCNGKCKKPLAPDGNIYRWSETIQRT